MFLISTTGSNITYNDQFNTLTITVNAEVQYKMMLTTKVTKRKKQFTANKYVDRYQYLTYVKDDGDVHLRGALISPQLMLITACYSQSCRPKVIEVINAAAGYAIHSIQRRRAIEALEARAPPELRLWS